MNLAIKSDPYFFKVKKIQFKPYACEEEMEFIQIEWPIQLDDLYAIPENKFGPPKDNGWSGPTFNKWATTESNHEKTSPHSESVQPDGACKRPNSSLGLCTFNPCFYHFPFFVCLL